ncbi:MAG: family 20 glycosylhydrolase [Clostridia bacterium]|nr:family 20 glycosylhydrolase [Clostridia bacterium]
MIIPRVKSYKETEKTWKYSGAFALTFENCPFSTDVEKALKLFLPDTKFCSCGCKLNFKGIDEKHPDEWYRFTVTEDVITAEFCDKRGAINAAASITCLVLDGEAPCGIIEDHPDYSHRGVMIDLARSIREPLQDVKDVIVYMAMSKMNRVHFHLMDSESICFKSDSAPQIKGTKARNGRQYTKEQLSEIVELCDTFAIEAIPEIEVPAHATALIEAFPQFACDTDIENQSHWCICPTSDEVFELYENIIKEVCSIFHGKYLHVGGDELYFNDAPRLNMLCHWDVCRKCRAFREKKGLSGIQEQYYYVMKRIYDIVKSCGKTMVMWNDQIDISKESPIPKDVLIAFWRIAYPGRGPYENCTMEDFARQGYKLYNSIYEKTYVDLDEYLREDELKSWSPVTYPEISDEFKQQVVGSEMCAWEYGNRENYGFYDYTLKANIPMFADRLWDATPQEYDEDYRKENYKMIFGKKLTKDLSPIFGGFLPPRSAKIMTHVEHKDIDTDLIAAVIDELSEIEANGHYSRQRYEYIKLLRDIAKLKYLADNQ